MKPVFIAIFVLGLTAGYASVGGIDRLLAQRIIERDATELAHTYSLFFSEARAGLSRIPFNESEMCSRELQQYLRDETFDKVYIRWLALTKDGEIVCQSNDLGVDLVNADFYALGNGFTIAEPFNAIGANQELFLIRNFDDYEYVASIQALNPSLFIKVDCVSCLSYRATFSTNPPIIIESSFFETEAVIESSVTNVSSFMTVSFTLKGDEELLEGYLNINHWAAIFVGVLLASGLCSVCFIWHRRQSSVDVLMKLGIKNKQFIPFYQPIIHSETQQLAGCEILARWRLADGTLIPPNQFIPTSEANGMIIPITRGLLQKVFQDIERFDAKQRNLFFSLNIVPEHLESDTFLEEVTAFVGSGVLGNNKLSLEITERYPIRDMVKAKELIEKFAKLNIDLKLDDAGTGYGSFNYVHNFGVSTLKIDKMFVDTIGDKTNFKGSTLSAIISFCIEDELAMIAEGVETKEQFDYLLAKKVDYIQGYYFSKPLPANRFFEWGMHVEEKTLEESGKSV